MGGRGRGRGGGRGGWGGRGGPTGPVARDDDGTILSTQVDGPPPLFPEMEMPEAPAEISAKYLLLVRKRHDLISAAKHSPFFLEAPKQEKGDLESVIDRHSDRTSKRAKRRREPLSTVMTLIPDYFPDELYSSQDKKAMKLQTSKSQAAFWKAQAGKGGDEGLLRLEQFAALEKSAKEDEEQEEPPPEEIPQDEDEEEDMENDDYYQGEHFDDDEDYGDDFDDGGGDDGPIF